MGQSAEGTVWGTLLDLPPRVPTLPEAKALRPLLWSLPFALERESLDPQLERTTGAEIGATENCQGSNPRTFQSPSPSLPWQAPETLHYQCLPKRLMLTPREAYGNLAEATGNNRRLCKLGGVPEHPPMRGGSWNPTMSPEPTDRYRTPH